MLPLPDFEDITYLKRGSLIQQKGYNILNHSKILYHLHSYRPVLTGTLPLDIFLEGKSDLDIICQAHELRSVEKILLKQYAMHEAFLMQQNFFKEIETLLCRFKYQGFSFEIFCQQTPVEDQYAYRHMIVEYKLLQELGEGFRDQIIKLKQSGMKTEPAFAFALGLKGDPYEALLLLE